MRRLLIAITYIALALVCQAQLPVIPVVLSTAASGIPDYRVNLLVDVESDIISSAGTNGAFYTQGNVMFEWTNVAAGANIGNSTYSFTAPAAGTQTWPYWTNNVTPLGTGAWDFSKNGNQNWRPLITNPGAAQPYAFFFVIRCPANSGNTQVFSDGDSGARTEITDNGIFSGTTLLGSGAYSPAGWVIAEIRNNGGTVVDYRTNQVNFIANGSGSAGSAGWAHINLGNENSFAGTFKLIGQIAAIRVYNEDMTDNHQAQVWTNLYKRYIGTTPPR